MISTEKLRSLKAMFWITTILSLIMVILYMINLQPSASTTSVLHDEGRVIVKETNGRFKKLESKHLSSEIRNKIKTLLLFIGYPRSGHTLIGSLLDAHPHIVVANEYNFVERWINWTAEHKNAKEWNLIDKLYMNSYEQSVCGFRSPNKRWGRSYAVPNQWQGKYKNVIKVIGDKKGGLTTKLLASNQQTLTNISRTLRLPIKIIHVVRNPFDNIATMLLRKLNIKTSRDELVKKPVNKTKRLLSVAKYYMTIAKTNLMLLQRFGQNVITLHSEDVIKNPKEAIEKLCRFLQVICTEDYLQDCATIIYKKPSKSRHTMIWSKDAKEYVASLTKKISFLNRYSFDV